MFDKILDLVIQLWTYVSPAEVVDAYEGGVVLRLGKYHRTLGPGFHWKWPLIERAITTNTCITTMRLPPQTLTTTDDHPVVISAIVKYSIRDPKPFLLDIWDSTDVLADVTMGAVRQAVNGGTYADLVSSPIEKQVVELVRKEVNKFGFQILAITFTDMGKVKSLRLIGATLQPTNLAN